MPISALVPQISKFEKCVRSANEITDDVMLSTQYNVKCTNRAILASCVADYFKWQKVFRYFKYIFQSLVEGVREARRRRKKTLLLRKWLGKILEQSQSSETKRNTKREKREPGIEAGLNPDDDDDEDFPRSKEFSLRPFFNTVL